LFIEHIRKQALPDLCLCSPDFGGIKRIKAYRKNLNAEMVVINKERLKANAVESMEIIGDVNGRNVIIVDDIVDTAGTLCAAADLLMKKGARSVRAYCTHGVLSGSALETIRKSELEKLYISDTVTETIDHPDIEIVTCAPILAAAIDNVIQNKSLSQL